MAFLDLRTVFTSYILTDLLCLAVMTIVWIQSRKRTPATGFWLADYALQFVGLLLIALRPVLPQLLSVVVGNGAIIGGTVLLYIGLERYVGRPGRQWHNHLMLAVLAVVETYLVFAQSTMAPRNVVASLALLFVSAQAAWLLGVRVDAETRRATWPTAAVFLAFCFASLVRVPIDLFVARPVVELFASDPIDTTFILIYQILFAALTFSLVLLISRRLQGELEGDLLDRARAEVALRKSEQQFRVAFETVPDAIIITRMADGRIVDANEGFERITGHSKEESIGKTTLDLGVWAIAAERETFIGGLVSHGRVADFEFTLQRKHGGPVPAVLYGERIDLDGVDSILTVFEDATARKFAEAQLKDLSNHDSLTGLLNHRAFYASAAEKIAAAHDSWIAAVFIDLDDLKPINDRFGHPAGDRALVAFAKTLRAGFRESDLIGRLGGDEFAILAVSREHVPDETFLGRYRAELEKYNASRELRFKLSASAGIAWHEPGTPVDLAELVKEADARMYEAKKRRHQAE